MFIFYFFYLLNIFSFKGLSIKTTRKLNNPRKIREVKTTQNISLYNLLKSYQNQIEKNSTLKTDVITLISDLNQELYTGIGKLVETSENSLVTTLDNSFLSLDSKLNEVINNHNAILKLNIETILDQHTNTLVPQNLNELESKDYKKNLSELISKSLNNIISANNKHDQKKKKFIGNMLGSAKAYEQAIDGITKLKENNIELVSSPILLKNALRALNEEKLEEIKLNLLNDVNTENPDEDLEELVGIIKKSVDETMKAIQDKIMVTTQDEIAAIEKEIGTAQTTLNTDVNNTITSLKDNITQLFANIIQQGTYELEFQVEDHYHSIENKVLQPFNG